MKSSTMRLASTALSFVVLSLGTSARADDPVPADGAIAVPTMPATAMPPAPTVPATATPQPARITNEPLTVPAGAVTQTDTTPMPVVIEPPPWRLRLGADLSGGVLFPGPALSGGIAARIGAQRDRLGLLVELGLHGGLGGSVSGTDDDHVATGAALALASATPMVQLDVADGGFVGLGVVLGAGTWTYTEDSVDGDDITQRASRSAAFIPGVDARLGWRFGDAHNFTITAGAKVLATSVHTDTVVASTTATPAHDDVDGIGVAVLPTISIGYDFK